MPSLFQHPSSATPRTRSRDQGGTDPRGMGGRARQAGPEGSGRALDGKVVEGQTRRGRLTAPRPCGAGLWVQEPPRHRPAHGLIRTWTVTDAARHDGAQLPNLVSKANTASDVWADTAYRSKANEKHLADNGLRSRIHRKKPPGRPMPINVARANSAKSKIRAAVEHVFARQKGPMA